MTSESVLAASSISTATQVSEAARCHPEDISQWVQLAKDGDKSAWDKIVEQLYPRIFHYLIHFIGNTHDAQDVTQDTFIKVYQKLHQHRGESSFTSWIFTVARRTALNHFRDRKPSEELNENITTSDDSPSEQAIARDDTQQLWNIVNDLKPIARQALWLRYGDGLSINDIASILGKTSLYIRVLLHRSKLDLAQKMQSRQ